ncbi:MAG TPA: hypothetical protein VNX70_20100 [Bryobacteraceae bacterium]|nr:hypothetical protein [Bryobacteraceae bacterium]
MYPSGGRLVRRVRVLSLRGINYQAADARPYALGTCIAAGSLLLLIRWLDSRLSHGFVIYGGDHTVWFWREWLAARGELSGWRDRRLGPFGDVDVVAFERH